MTFSKEIKLAIGGSLLAAGLALTAGTSLAGTSFQTNPVPPLPPQPTFRIPGIERPATLGPFIGDSSALQKGADYARGPITRQEVHLIPYAALSAYLGSTDYRIDPARQFYFVVTSAPYTTRGGPFSPSVTCRSYIAAFDATSGDAFVAGCEGLGSWPDRVPAGFSKQ